MADKFPLWKHKGTGLWCRKYKGRAFYFGPDKDAALKRFVAEWDDIVAGRSPGRTPDAASLPLADLCNLFLHAKRQQVDSGELAPSTWAAYRDMTVRVLGVLGRNRTVADMGPADYGRIRAEAASRLGPSALTHFITLARTMFKFGSDLTERTPKYGDQFKRPAAKVLRAERHRKGPRLVSAEDLRKLIEAASPILRAQILLALNAGYRQTDCAELEQSALDTRPGWLAEPRRKTGAPRLCPLWEETQEALAVAIPLRPAPADPSLAGRVFLGPRGRPAVYYVDRVKGGSAVDMIGKAWKSLCEKEGIQAPGSFGILRHVHRTVADGALDKRAADLIMGHLPTDMAGHYIETVDDSRLVAVVETVRIWLWPKTKAGQ